MLSLRTVPLLAVILHPLAADASFSGTPCRADFGCHFLFWGVLLAVAGGLPAACVAFALLHLGFRHEARSKANQAILGGVAGIVAFEVSAACAALVASRGANPWIGLFACLAALAILSALYARSGPRDAPDDEGGASAR